MMSTWAVISLRSAQVSSNYRKFLGDIVERSWVLNKVLVFS